MKILSIDTSSNVCSVAILEDEKILDEVNLNNGKTHSENMMPILAELMQKNEMKLEEFDLISCVTGPGSFTGIRIGVSAVKAIAEVKKIPVIGVTSLETLARSDVSDKNKAVLIDARNNQVYAGIFDENYHAKEDFFADSIEVVIQKMKAYDHLICIGSGAVLHQEQIKNEIPDIVFSEQNDQLAKFAGCMAYQKYQENPNGLQTADSLVPTYFRKSQAERLKKG